MRNARPHLTETTFLAADMPAAGLGRRTDPKGGDPNDAAFVTNVSGAGLAEFGVGKLAVTNAHSDKVKTFAHQLVANRTKASDTA